MALNDPVYTQTERDEWPHLIGIKKNLYSPRNGSDQGRTGVFSQFLRFPGTKEWSSGRSTGSRPGFRIYENRSSGVPRRSKISGHGKLRLNGNKRRPWLEIETCDRITTQFTSPLAENWMNTFVLQKFCSA
jgi:hypothetical protein